MLHVYMVSLLPSTRMNMIALRVVSKSYFANFMGGVLDTSLNEICVCLFLRRKG